MRIVQSFWSKPSFKHGNLNISDRNKGGWTDKKYNYFSWALSCLQFRKYYDEVELVTDKQGYDLLINRLGLPYTHVNVVLDKLNDYHSDLWALGKIYAYSIQEQPFLHADGDIFIYEPFPVNISRAPLIAQNREPGFSYYNDVFDKILSRFEYIPDYFHHSRQKHQQIVAVNAGIIGGNDITFFKEYTAMAITFVDRNKGNLEKINIGLFNNVYEQFLFHAMAEGKLIDINYLFPAVNHAFDGLADFTGVPQKTKYIHTVGVYKRMPYMGELLAYRLQTDYPEYYYKILNLIRSNSI